MRGIRKSLAANAQEPRRSTKLAARRSKSESVELSPEEQAKKVKDHRLRLQAATNSIEESISQLYQKKPKEDSNQSPRAADQVKVHAAGEDDVEHQPSVPAGKSPNPRRMISKRSTVQESSKASSTATASARHKDLVRSSTSANELPSSPSKQDDEEMEAESPSGKEDAPSDPEGVSEISSDDVLSSEAMLESDGSDAEFDVDESRQKVGKLLKDLNVDQRVEVMDFLNSWFTERTSRISYDSESLKRIEDERTRDYVEAETAFGTVGDKLKESEEATISMVRQMHQSVTKVDIKPKKVKPRPKTGMPQKEYEQLTTFNPDDDQNVNLEMGIQQLRAQLMEKEAKMRRIAHDAGGDDPVAMQVETDELLASLNRQQDEINDLNRQVTYGESRVRLLKAALDHISLGNAEINMPDKDVAEIIREMRTKVHAGKIQELMAKRQLEYGDELKLPDDVELQQLRAECEEMHEKLKGLEDDIAELKSPETLDKEIQDQLAAIKAGQMPSSGSILDEVVGAEVQPERAPEVKAKLHCELLKAQEEEDKLTNQLQHYKQLSQAAEKTLKTMEDQRTLFLDSVTTARACHWGSMKKGTEEDGEKETSEGGLIDSSMHHLFIQDESENFDVETVRKQDEAMAKLREEEIRLETQLEELCQKNQDLFDSMKAEEQKKDILQEDLDEAKDNFRKAAYGDNVSPELVAQVAELTSGNKEKLAQIRLRRQKLCGFDVHDTLPHLRFSSVKESPIYEVHKDRVDDATDFEQRIQAVKRAVEEQMVGAPMPVVDKSSLEIAMRSGEKPSEEQLAQILAMQCSKDLRELLDVQAENANLAKEVAALEEQIRKARAHNKSTGMDDMSTRSARDLRRKQRELNALRAQWTARERVRREKEGNSSAEEDDDVADQDDPEMGIHGDEESQATTPQEIAV